MAVSELKSPKAAIWPVAFSMFALRASLENFREIPSPDRLVSSSQREYQRDLEDEEKDDISLLSGGAHWRGWAGPRV